jgi:hypothetical protein
MLHCYLSCLQNASTVSKIFNFFFFALLKCFKTQNDRPIICSKIYIKQYVGYNLIIIGLPLIFLSK